MKAFGSPQPRILGVCLEYSKETEILYSYVWNDSERRYPYTGLNSRIDMCRVSDQRAYQNIVSKCWCESKGSPDFSYTIYRCMIEPYCG